MCLHVEYILLQVKCVRSMLGTCVCVSTCRVYSAAAASPCSVDRDFLKELTSVLIHIQPHVHTHEHTLMNTQWCVV